MAKRLAKCSQLLKIHCHFCRGNKDNCIVYSHKCALAKEDGPECNKDILKLMEKHFRQVCASRHGIEMKIRLSRVYFRCIQNSPFHT